MKTFTPTAVLIACLVGTAATGGDAAASLWKPKSDAPKSNDQVKNVKWPSRVAFKVKRVAKVLGGVSMPVLFGGATELVLTHVLKVPEHAAPSLSMGLVGGLAGAFHIMNAVYPTHRDIPATGKSPVEISQYIEQHTSSLYPGDVEALVYSATKEQKSGSKVDPELAKAVRGYLEANRGNPLIGPKAVAKLGKAIQLTDKEALADLSGVSVKSQKNREFRLKAARWGVRAVGFGLAVAAGSAIFGAAFESIPSMVAGAKDAVTGGAPLVAE